MTTNTENRNQFDTPLSEADCQLFSQFFFDFLGGSESEQLNFLKAITLMRQGTRRAFVYSLINAREYAEKMLPEVGSRNLLLTFPSTMERVWQAACEKQQMRRSSNNLPVFSEQDLVANCLTSAENVREYLAIPLSRAGTFIPKDKFKLALSLSKTGELAKAGRGVNLLLVILSSKPFICVLPEDASHFTMAIGQLRSYINQILKGSTGQVQIEFFTVGGCQLQRQRHVELTGSNSLFDVMFANVKEPCSKRIAELYHHIKFSLIHELLSAEFPGEVYSWHADDAEPEQH